MLSFEDKTAEIAQQKSVRMEQRTKPHVKTEIQRAAAMLGIDETAFVTSAAFDKARATIAEYEHTQLAEADRDMFFEALAEPSAPTDELLAAVALHRKAVKRRA